jgi:hypothetical protein
MERRRRTGFIPSWPCIAGVAEGPAMVAGGGDACGSQASGRNRGVRGRGDSVHDGRG